MGEASIVCESSQCLPHRVLGPPSLRVVAYHAVLVSLLSA